MQARKWVDYLGAAILKDANGVIFDGGAGLAPAYSWIYDYPLGKAGQEVILCDADERLLQYAPLMLGDAMRHAKYVCGDFCKEAQNYVNKVRRMRLTGFLSYFPTYEKRLEVMHRAKDSLVPDGQILVDSWVLGPSLIRSGITDLWPSRPTDPVRLTPATSVDAAIDEMDKITKALGLKYVYAVDECNGNPKCLTQVKASPKCVLFLVGNDVSQDMLPSIW